MQICTVQEMCENHETMHLTSANHRSPKGQSNLSRDALCLLPTPKDYPMITWMTWFEILFDKLFFVLIFNSAFPKIDLIMGLFRFLNLK